MHHTTNTTSKHGTIAPTDDPGAFGPGSNPTTTTTSAASDGEDEGDSNGDVDPPLFR